MAKRKIVKPTEYEQAQIDKALKRKYPHMLKEAWIKKLKKGVRKELTKRRRSKTYQLAMAGITKKKIKKLRD